MNIAHIEETSLIYGPGIRFVIWTQGCSIRCRGCWNKEMWSFKTKYEYSIGELITKIRNSNNIEGVTILGGEPFDQYDECLNLVEQIRKLNLTTIVYTGYEIKELKANNKNEIFKHIDILVTGPFVENLKTSEGGLIGSTNQKIIFFTNKYNEQDLVKNNESEISIDENGKITAYGYYKYDLQKLL